MRFTTYFFATLVSPLGANIGSQTVPEIAISIMAELIAHRNLGAVPRGLREEPETGTGRL